MSTKSIGTTLTETRYAAERKRKAAEARQRTEARKICPLCGDRFPVSFKNRLSCRHCLAPLTLPA